jgi:hypothetical protein
MTFAHRHPGLALLPLCALSFECQSRTTEPSPGRLEPELRGATANANAPVGEPTPSGVAVVELFTSEGCSSCPPAEANLAELASEAERDGAPVFTLELHVDYWDGLGWVDPFGSRVNSDRQRAYAHARGERRVYTPQMIVNGSEQFVGSDEDHARAAIERALAHKATAVIALRARASATGIDIHYSSHSSEPAELHLAVAEDRVETRVTRGENAGRTLEHRHAVRAFHTVHVDTEATGDWTAPWSSDTSSRVYAVAYVTEPSTMAVLGASAVIASAGR